MSGSLNFPTAVFNMSCKPLGSVELDLPPSCIEVCPEYPNYFLVGTYHLETPSASLPIDGETSSEGESSPKAKVQDSNAKLKREIENENQPGQVVIEAESGNSTAIGEGGDEHDGGGNFYPETIQDPIVDVATQAQTRTGSLVLFKWQYPAMSVGYLSLNGNQVSLTIRHCL
jgi:hypothetical protein